MKIEGSSVHAITQACWLGTIIKHVPEVAAATGTHNFNATHAKAAVNFCNHFGTVQRFIKAGPSAACIKLALRAEEFVSACCANVCSSVPFFFKCTGKWTLGAFFAQHAILFGRELLLPFFFAFLHFKFVLVVN